MWGDWAETVTLRRITSAGSTVHGDPVDPAEDEIPIEGALFAPEPGSETSVGQDTTDTKARVYLPAGSPVPDALDEMDVRGETWQVHGRSGNWPDGVEVFLRKAG